MVCMAWEGQDAGIASTWEPFFASIMVRQPPWKLISINDELILSHGVKCAGRQRKDLRWGVEEHHKWAKLGIDKS